MTQPLLEGGGAALSQEDLALAVRTGEGKALARSLLLRRIAARRAEAEGLTASPEDVTQAVTEFHVGLDLFEEEQVRAWHAHAHVEPEALHDRMREVVLARRLKERLVTDEAILRRYRESMHDHGRVVVQVLHFPTDGMARETLLALREGEIAWDDAATRAGGATPSVLRRCEAPSEVAASLFSASPLALVGPHETDDRLHAVYRVLAREPPRLDAALRDKLADEIFDEQLERALARDPMRLVG